ncbi:MAG: RnfABCDGE type electron transport complex subunit D [Candidatus Omnitrophica bacterium]|nr:RnfABCDGE type electron transport complex subunit D [Candidatus Omnitrophota bacterium]
MQTEKITLNVSASPHLESAATTPFIMRQVIIALIPATIAGLILFRIRAALLIVICVFVSIATEEVISRIRKKPSTITDYSAALTGLLLALILPPTTSWYGAILGSIFAILVGKHLFGGLGMNIFNPALIGRAFLMASYPKMLTTYIKPFAADSISCATPLALNKFSQIGTPLTDLFFGGVSGSIGETSAICLIVGGIYILIRKIADWRIPVSMLVTTIVFSTILYLTNNAYGSPLFHILSGGLLLGVFFMATDPVTTPVTKKGRYVFGITAAIMIMVIRVFGGLSEGVMYSILFMNALTPLINRYTKPKRFGA